MRVTVSVSSPVACKNLVEIRQVPCYFITTVAAFTFSAFHLRRDNDTTC